MYVASWNSANRISRFLFSNGLSIVRLDEEKWRRTFLYMRARVRFTTKKKQREKNVKFFDDRSFGYIFIDGTAQIGRSSFYTIFHEVRKKVFILMSLWVKVTWMTYFRCQEEPKYEIRSLHKVSLIFDNSSDVINLVIVCGPTRVVCVRQKWFHLFSTIQLNWFF